MAAVSLKSFTIFYTLLGFYLWVPMYDFASATEEQPCRCQMLKDKK